MDAVPVTLGQEFAGYAAQVRLGARRCANALPQVAQIPLGGTATGTGLNTHPEFAERVRTRLANETGLEIRAPETPFEARATATRLSSLSGALKVVAVSADQDRQRPGLDGLRAARGHRRAVPARAPERAPRSCPARSTRLIPEVVLQIGAQVMGNDVAITIAGSQGNFELNVRIPLIARNLLESIHLLAAGSTLCSRPSASRASSPT